MVPSNRGPRKLFIRSRNLVYSAFISVSKSRIFFLKVSKSRICYRGRGSRSKDCLVLGRFPFDRTYRPDRAFGRTNVTTPSN